MFYLLGGDEFGLFHLIFSALQAYSVGLAGLSLA